MFERLELYQRLPEENLKRGRNVYYELYIDVLFLVNFLMDYILLLVAKKVLRFTSSYGRICVGALLGAFLTCIVTAVGIPFTFMKVVLFYILVPSAMLLTALPIRSLQSFFRALVTLYISGFLVGGIFEYLNQYIEVGSLFFALAMASYYLASGVLKILAMLFHFGESHCSVILFFGGKSCRAEAIVDTGNHLRDEVSGKSVSIISNRLAEKLFGEKMPEGLRYIPYRTIGKGTGVIPVLSIDLICIDGKEEQRVEQPMVAISEESSFGSECDVILNPDI
ncbi:MAG: sigma-E processing peptidase SpoIIGA [Dorea sp.]|nr:sigma-E processing peptidase SpoIIGA [Dorea sp.]